MYSSLFREFSCLTEFWFRLELEIKLPGYMSLFNSRKDRRGGGVGIHMKNDPLIGNSSTEINSDTGNEFSTSRLSLRSNDLTICAVYRLPNLSFESSNLLYESIRSIPGRNLFLMGEFNFWGLVHSQIFPNYQQRISGCIR